MNFRFQHGPGQWTTGTKVASRDSIDHRGLSKRCSSENKPFFISVLHHCHLVIAHIRGDHVAGQCVLALSVHKHQGDAYHPVGSAQEGLFHPYTAAFFIVALETAMCHKVYLPKQLSIQIVNAASHGSCSTFLISDKP